MTDGEIDPEQKRVFIRRMRVKSLLSEWYGPAYAARENAIHGAPAKPVADWLPEITKNVFSAETGGRMVLEKEWDSTVGEPFSRMCRPGGIENGVLTLEIRHSAYRKEIENAFPLLLTLINRAPGGPFCQSLRVEAANRRNRKFDMNH